MQQSLRFYNEVYPLYLGEGLKEQIVDSFPVLEDLDGFIAFGTCDYVLLGQHFGNYLAFDNAVHREVAGQKLMRAGLDMKRVALSKPIKITNPMPVYKEYRESKDFRENIHSKLKLYNDRVVLTNEELIKIIESVKGAIDKNQISLREIFNLEELPLPNMSLILGTRTYNFATNAKERKIRFEHYLLNNCLYKVELTNEIDEVSRKIQTLHAIKFVSPVITHKDMEYDQFQAMFLAINYYIKHIPASYSEVKKKVSDTIEVGKGHNKRYKQVVHLERIYDFKNLDKMSKTHLKHIFTCLCWGVRGHFRHLKNGKVVFVKPFKKGKERNNMEAFSGKEYRL